MARRFLLLLYNISHVHTALYLFELFKFKIHNVGAHYTQFDTVSYFLIGI